MSAGVQVAGVYCTGCGRGASSVDHRNEAGWIVAVTWKCTTCGTATRVQLAQPAERLRRERGRASTDAALRDLRNREGSHA